MTTRARKARVEAETLKSRERLARQHRLIARHEKAMHEQIKALRQQKPWLFD
jgi:hypothetical protein